ncbi:putative protein kinase RLK-Pelle-LRR-VIII-1 family [Helianthus annuus]|nr:putative protein kinase RLK-Pelle-LRR-VIII-1 family [Helianthus annuus]
MSSSLHEFAHLHIPLEDISLATRNFADENTLGVGLHGAGKLYKGQLKWSGQLIDIVARKLEGIYMEAEIELWTEISMLTSLNHKNLGSIVGFCNEHGEKIIIYKHALHGSLHQYLSDPELTWPQRLNICLGVGRALSYIHCDVIHCDISSYKILIDEDWEAKVFGFELSTKYPGSFVHRLLVSRYVDTSPYKDPMYRNTLSLTPKYDVYSFGVLLYDVLCGGKPMSRYDCITENLDEIIDPNLRKQMDTQSLTIFLKVAYNCLNKACVQRPSMDQIVKELENTLEFQCNPENLVRLLVCWGTQQLQMKLHHPTA